MKLSKFMNFRQAFFGFDLSSIFLLTEPLYILSVSGESEDKSL